MKIYSKDVVSILIVIVVIVGFHILGFFEQSSILLEFFAPLRNKIYHTIEDAGDLLDETEMAEYSPEEGFLILSDFELPEELQKWRYEDVILYQSNQYKSNGNHSGKVEFLANQGDAPKLFLQYFPKRWSNFEALDFDVYNPSDEQLRIILQIKDRKSNRFKYNLILEPQRWNHFSIPIDNISKTINVDKVVDLNFFRWKPTKNVSVYFDDVKLITSQYEDTKVYATPAASQQKVRDITTKDDYHVTKTEYSSGNTITFFVNNPNKIKISDAPCSGIVEFPESQVYDKTPLLLKGPEGIDLPYQLLVQNYWTDNSFREARIDFRASFSEFQEKQFLLYYGTGLAKMNFKSGITVRYKEDHIEVSTGKLRFNLNKHSFNIIDKAWLDTNGDGFYSENEVVAESGDIIITYNGIFYQSSYDYSTYKIEMLEAGPMRTTFQAEGYLRSSSGFDLCKYIALITAFSDQSYIEMSLNFIFSKNSAVESAALIINYPEDFTQVYSPHTGVQMDLPVILYQPDYEKSEVRSQGRKLTFDQDLSRWIDASSQNGGVTVAVNPYWSLPQLGYYVYQNNLAVMLWPPYAQEIDIKYAIHTKLNKEYKNRRNQDFVRTHDILIYFHEKDLEQVHTTEIAETFLNPVIFSKK